MTYLDDTPVPVGTQALGGGNFGDIGSFLVNDQFSFSQFGQDRQTAEQTKAYKHWTYVALSRIANYVSTFFPNFSYQPNAPESPDRQSMKELKQAYARRLNNRMHGLPVNEFGYSVQSVNWLKTKYKKRVTQSGVRPEELQPIPANSPIVELLCYPNEYQSYGQLTQEFCLNKRLTGRAYLWVIPNRIRSEYAPNGLPAELHVLPTRWVEEKFKPSGELEGYLVTPDGDIRRQKMIRPSNMVKATNTDPVDKLKGKSEVQAGESWIDNSEDIERSRRASFANGRNPDVIVSLDEETFKSSSGKMSKGELIDLIKERFRQRTKGVEKHGEPLIQPPGVTITPYSLSPREMDFGISGDTMRDNVLALHGVHHIIAGISKDYNRATSLAAWGVFCQISANPELLAWAEVLQKLADRFNPRILVWFDDCTPEDPELALQRMKAGLEAGAVSLDEYRAFVGLDPMGTPEYESGYMPAGKIPVSMALDTEPLDDEESEDIDDEETETEETEESEAEETVAA